MKTKDALALIDLFSNTEIDFETIQEGVFADNLHYKLILASKANKIVMQGFKRRFGVLVEAQILDNGDVGVEDLKHLHKLFKSELENKLAELKDREEEAERIQKLLENKPRSVKTKSKENKTKKSPASKVKSKGGGKSKENKTKNSPDTPAIVSKPAGVDIKGVRYNEGKIRYDLVPPVFIREIAEVLTYGAVKYSAHNWKYYNDEQKQEIKGSLLRHIYAYLEGEEFDSESGLHHLAHAGCNLAFLAYFRNGGGLK